MREIRKINSKKRYKFIRLRIRHLKIELRKIGAEKISYYKISRKNEPEKIWKINIKCKKNRFQMRGFDGSSKLSFKNWFEIK